ncbi:ATP-dependent RNA helicase DBP2 [Trichinella nativa]|uniref:RNA helicase n=1 Tax=Trichinella nativa TaxID=6335 RepID=A0A0V1LHJ1_9BILA|nr:ATP-dependent RNA helicase DBP2 [Trichinella nativa]
MGRQAVCRDSEAGYLGTDRPLVVRSSERSGVVNSRTILSREDVETWKPWNQQAKAARGIHPRIEVMVQFVYRTCDNFYVFVTLAIICCVGCSLSDVVICHRLRQMADNINQEKQFPEEDTSIISVHDGSDSAVTDANVENEANGHNENKEMSITSERSSSEQCVVVDDTFTNDNDTDSDSTLYDDSSDCESEERSEIVPVDMKKGNYLRNAESKIFVDGDIDLLEYYKRMKYHSARRDRRSAHRRHYRRNSISANPKKSEERHFRQRDRRLPAAPFVEKLQVNFGQLSIADYSKLCRVLKESNEGNVHKREQANSKVSYPAKIPNEPPKQANERTSVNESPDANEPLRTDSPLIANMFNEFTYDGALLAKLQALKVNFTTSIYYAAELAFKTEQDLLYYGDRTSTDALAYLLPIVSKLHHRSKIRGNGTPQAVIVVNSVNDAVTVYTLCETLLSGTDFRCVRLYGDIFAKQQLPALFNGCDILVGVPECITRFMKDGLLSLCYCRFFIFDEIDEMLRGRRCTNTRIIADVKPNVKYLAAAFATSKSTEVEIFADLYLNCNKLIEMDCIGSVANRKVISQKFIAVKSDKIDQFLALIKDIVLKHPNKNQAPKIVIFVTRKRLAYILAAMLLLEGFKALSLQGDYDQLDRETTTSLFKTDFINMLVSTDISLTYYHLGVVNYLINFEMPCNLGKYLNHLNVTEQKEFPAKCISLFDPSCEMNRVKEILFYFLRNYGESPEIDYSSYTKDIDEKNTATESQATLEQDAAAEETQQHPAT